MGAICEKMKKRRLSKIGYTEKEAIYYKEPTITEAQKTAILINWDLLKQHVTDVGVITFVSMFEDNPEMKEIFSSFKGKDMTELHTSGLIRVHALRVMATVDKCIKRLNEPDNLRNLLRSVGKNHGRFKVTAKQMQSMLPHFINAIQPHIQTNWNDEVECAWRAMFKLMLYHIARGMDDSIVLDE